MCVVIFLLLHKKKSPEISEQSNTHLFIPSQFLWVRNPSTAWLCPVLLTRLQSVSQGWGLSWGRPEEGFASKLRWLLAGFSSSRGCQMEASASVTHGITYRLEASHRHYPHTRGEDYTRHWLGAILDSSSGLQWLLFLPHAKRTCLSSSPGVSSHYSINLSSRISTSTSVPGVIEVPGM